MKLSIQAVYDWYRQVIRNPKYRWWVVAATLGYLVLPIDLLPDFLPIAGQLDDVVILTLLATELTQILTDWFRTRRGSVTTDAPTGEQISSEETTSVDVKAVSVE